LIADTICRLSQVMVAKPGRPSGIGKALAAAPPPTTACYGALRTDFARRLIGQGEL